MQQSKTKAVALMYTTRAPPCVIMK